MWQSKKKVECRWAFLFACLFIFHYISQILQIQTHVHTIPWTNNRRFLCFNLLINLFTVSLNLEQNWISTHLTVTAKVTHSFLAPFLCVCFCRWFILFFGKENPFLCLNPIFAVSYRNIFTVNFPLTNSSDRLHYIVGWKFMSLKDFFKYLDWIAWLT